MQMGFNNDVSYKELVLHIQTEDHGLSTMKVTSQVFFSGAVLESKTISYAKEVKGIEDAAERDERIRTFMKALHRKFYKRIQEGHYDDKLPLGEAAAEASHLTVASSSGDEGLDTPEDLIVEEGFAVAGEAAELGATYEAHSRGEPVESEEFEPGRLVDEIAAAASGMGHEGFVQLGGVGSGSYAVAVDASHRSHHADELIYGDQAAYRGLDADYDDLGPFLLTALQGG